MARYAWVTLATNDAYSLGALVLAHSLRRVGTKHELACMVTPGVTSMMREKLAAVFSLVQEVNVLDSKDEANLALLARPELGITFTKLHCWRLTQYEKCVFVDADALVVRNCDELFEREELSAAPDVGWPDCFNSGVFVFKPSQQTFASIISFATSHGSFDGGDQGLLNMYFSDWASKDISKHLPFIYNMCSTATYSYLPAFKQFGEDVRIIHFIGITKPWLQYFDTLTGEVQSPAGCGHLQPLLQLWWNLFCEQVHPQLSVSMVATRLSGLLLPDTCPQPRVPAPATFVPHDVNDDAYNDISQGPPDFSEFKDPWEDHQHYNAVHQSLNERVAFTNENDRNETDRSSSRSTHSYGRPEEKVSWQSDERRFELGRDHTAPSEHYQHTTSHSEVGYNQHSAPHTGHQHWQPSEYQHHHEQQQHNIQRHRHEQHHDEEERQSDGHHRHFEHFQQDSRHESNDEAVHHSTQHQPAHEYYEWRPHSVEVKHESHSEHRGNNQASHETTEYHEFRAERVSSDNQSASNERSSEAADNRTNEPRFDSRPLPPAPNSDLHNIAAQTDPSAADHAGIAGALAQLTLGVARSEQQLVLEEQMRKQSWEQGHIDYMGQDSFDNIWKKICETLSQAQQRQTTPPKEDKPKDETTPAAPAAPAAVEQQAPAVETVKDLTQEQSLECKLPEEKLPAQVIPAENVVVAQPCEQKAPALPAEEKSVTEAAATSVLGEPVHPATVDACVKPCETSTEVPSPKPPVEPLPCGEAAAEQCQQQCVLVTKETAPQDKSAPLPAEGVPPAPQTPPVCLLASAICTPPVPETVAPVAPIESAPMPTDSQVAATPATPDPSQPTTVPASVVSPQDIAVPAAAPSKTPAEDTGKPTTECSKDVTQPLTIDPSERHAEMLLAASEVSTVSPVPIQVAESVLQAEPKESVSGANASDQAIATTVTGVTAPAEPKEQVVQLNGLEPGKRDEVAIAVPTSPEKTGAVAEPTKEPASDAVKDPPSQPPAEAKIEPVSSVVPVEKALEKEEAAKVTEQVPAATTEAAQTATSGAQETKFPEQQVAKTETIEAKSAEAKVEAAGEKAMEQPAKTEVAEAKPIEQTTKAEAPSAETTTAKAPSEAPESPVTETAQEPPEELAEAKQLNVPSTPTVIEATPPTSPSVEGAQETAESQEKAAKKSLKKSDSADGTDGEGGDKKGSKKTVKKVTKKPKSAKPEEATPTTPEAAPATATTAVAAAAAAAAATATGDNSQSKAKKPVKVTKKASPKSGQSLEADTTVPETPPPPTAASATPDVPVPPKRKTKASSTSAKGTAGKKPETEE